MSTWWNSPKETQGFWSEQVLDLMTLKWTPQTSSCSQLTLSCIRLQNRWLICQYLRFKEHVKAHINIWNFSFPGGKLRKYVTMVQRSHWATLVLLRAGCFPEAEPALYTYPRFPYSQLLWLQLTSSVYPTGLTSEFTTFGSPKVRVSASWRPWFKVQFQFLVLGRSSYSFQLNVLAVFPKLLWLIRHLPQLWFFFFL